MEPRGSKKAKKVVVVDAAVKEAGARATKASAKLEGREVPEDFVRSPAVERYIRERVSNPWPALSKGVEGQDKTDT